MLKGDDIDIRKLHMQLQDEMGSVVYAATMIGGMFGCCVVAALGGLTVGRAAVIIALGAVFGFYLGSLRKQDLAEKGLIIYSQIDLLDAGRRHLSTPPAPPPPPQKEEEEVVSTELVATTDASLPNIVVVQEVAKPVMESLPEPVLGQPAVKEVVASVVATSKKKPAVKRKSKR